MVWIGLGSYQNFLLCSLEWERRSWRLVLAFVFFVFSKGEEDFHVFCIIISSLLCRLCFLCSFTIADNMWLILRYTCRLCFTVTFHDKCWSIEVYGRRTSLHWKMLIQIFLSNVTLEVIRREDIKLADIHECGTSFQILLSISDCGGFRMTINLLVCIEINIRNLFFLSETTPKIWYYPDTFIKTSNHGTVKLVHKTIAN